MVFLSNDFFVTISLWFHIKYTDMTTWHRKLTTTCTHWALLSNCTQHFGGEPGIQHWKKILWCVMMAFFKGHLMLSIKVLCSVTVPWGNISPVHVQISSSQDEFGYVCKTPSLYCVCIIYHLQDGMEFWICHHLCCSPRLNYLNMV